MVREGDGEAVLGVGGEAAEEVLAEVARASDDQNFLLLRRHRRRRRRELAGEWGFWVVSMEIWWAR